MKVYTHPGLQDSDARAVPPAVYKDYTYQEPRDEVSYLKVNGGATAGEKGFVNSQATVDVTNLVWPGNVRPERSRVADQMAYPVLAEYEASARATRQWLREWAVKVIRAHQDLGLEGCPRIIVVGHGGQFNFLTKKFFCDVRQAEDDPSKWEWKGPTRMKHLGVSTWRFKEVEDGVDFDEAELEEMPICEAGLWYRGVFPGYRNLGVDEEWGDQGRREVDCKAGQWEWIRKAAVEMRRFAVGRTEVLKALLGWTGAREFLDEYFPGWEEEEVEDGQS